MSIRIQSRRVALAVGASVALLISGMPAASAINVSAGVANSWVCISPGACKQVNGTYNPQMGIECRWAAPSGGRYPYSYRQCTSWK